MSLLSIRNMSLAFGEKPVVKNLSLAIQKGEMLALVGESGSGKSLTALAIMGLQPPGAALGGEITFQGTALHSAHAESATPQALQALRGKRIAMVFQEPMTALNPLHTIGRQIMEMLTVHDPRGSGHRARVQALLEQVGLAHFKDRLDAFPHQLSGGERQRVMIAMAIANQPDLLIADEPTTAVDVTIQKKILELLKDLQRQMGMAILLITHDLTVVRRLADRVAVMKQGELVEVGAVETVFTAPKHAYTQLLLSSEPKGEAVPLPASQPPEPLLSCDNLRVHFPIRRGLLRRTVGHIKAVDGIGFSLRTGETIGIVGESGSGKTTLAFALLKLIASEGAIRFCPAAHPESDSAHPQSLRRHMQLVFQDPYSSLSPRLSVEQIIGEGLDVHERTLSRSERSRKILDILHEVGLDETALHRYPHEFSGGQRQRISIARSVVLRPQLLVLDEPTSALDLTIQSQIIELLKNLQRKYGMSYLFISHDLRVIRAIAHRILVMRKGQLVELGDTQQVLEHPREAYTSTLIEAAFLK
jgi:microcin C transport system ATP-binding protein